eukprot:Sspe_Gene.26270::Locus_10810_Transcript_1_1_Confidence_1.000_Length_3039::g.26270::m.26270
MMTWGQLTEVGRRSKRVGVHNWTSRMAVTLNLGRADSLQGREFRVSTVEGGKSLYGLTVTSMTCGLCFTTYQCNWKQNPDSVSPTIQLCILGGMSLTLLANWNW